MEWCEEEGREEEGQDEDWREEEGRDGVEVEVEGGCRGGAVIRKVGGEGWGSAEVACRGVEGEGGGGGYSRGCNLQGDRNPAITRDCVSHYTIPTCTFYL